MFLIIFLSTLVCVLFGYSIIKLVQLQNGERVQSPRKNKTKVITNVQEALEMQDELLGSAEDGIVKVVDYASQKTVDAVTDEYTVNQAQEDAVVFEETALKKPMQEQAAPLHVVLHVFASEGAEYTGYELLQTLLSSGLRYGKMNIFHRHEHKTGLGQIWFSLASAMEPGTFDLARMGAFKTKGLVMFMSADKVGDPLVAYEAMLETANQLVEDLGGKVYDEHRQLLTRAQMVATTQQLREYINQKGTLDLFA